ncbi:hypothetical protein B0A54_11005 [Friedmanniomyces endolithicus]|uniref:Uncharacterized protein n=1 Tax=Friedmanniomyces endolithicus TaxID=329885 RepID=A0A4U0UNT2_9PEZI|nr:hypothetical protein B0A54_11005 [Friedmanniomyces endolithicus]
MSTSRNPGQATADARFRPARQAKTLKATIDSNFKLLQDPYGLKKLAKTKSKADPEPGNENLLTIIRCQIAINKYAVDGFFQRNSEKANVYLEAMKKLKPIDTENVLMAYIEKYQVALPDLGTAQPHADTSPSDTSTKPEIKKRKAGDSSSLMLGMRKRRNAAHIEIESQSEDEGVIDSDIEDGRNAWESEDRCVFDDDLKNGRSAWESGTVMHPVRNRADAWESKDRCVFDDDLKNGRSAWESGTVMHPVRNPQEKGRIDAQKRLAIDLANELQQRFNRIAGARRAGKRYEGFGGAIRD